MLDPNQLASLILLATSLGDVAGANSSGWPDVAAAAEQIRAARADGRTPERDAFGEIAGMQELVLVAAELGADKDELRQINRAASNAAHDAEDLAILAEACPFPATPAPGHHPLSQP